MVEVKKRCGVQVAGHSRDAIGLRPPDFLVSAIRLPPNNRGLTSNGQAPCSKKLINPVISFSNAEDV